MKFLYFTILIPLISFLILSLFSNLNKKISTIIGIGSISIIAIITFIINLFFLKNNLLIYKESLWQIIKIDNFHVDLNLYLDMLSLIMLSVTTGVGLLIHIFASWYMRNDEGYSRFFAYTNLFMASMILLILADNFILMFFGWECVGVCSYLLIGFFYKNTLNGFSAIKAFLITRLGDIFLSIGIFLIFKLFKTINFQEISFLITSSNFYYSSFLLNIITLMLTIGAISKSAQFPLNTWLIDAMAGPTPVSALIHAATMVTAGVYLIIRNNILFSLTNNILLFISIIGTITLLISGLSALAQKDIKRILAYSTMSQIGYMFLALGIRSWEASLFHLIAHSFFKALLFLSVASIIISTNHEQNIFKMGNMKKYIPFIYYCFLLGGLSLCSFPIISISSFSKGQILYEALINHHFILVILGFIGTFITSLYITRMIYIIFFGQTNIIPIKNNTFNHNIPLIILIILSSFIGINLLPVGIYSYFHDVIIKHTNKYFILEIISAVISITGFIFFILFWKNRNYLLKFTKINNINFYIIKKFFLHGCYIDLIYKKLFVNNFFKILFLIKNDPISQVINIFIKFAQKTEQCLLIGENGYLRWYISSMCLGVIILLLIIILSNKYYLL
ncbi:NADH-quinone oxidoreductase subunit L [Enterobacteriaceae endosymbiont of Plateumaris consimilis]|uniref:NADH-quinone oxidoreductase subunit L n=1 Tax=Enterobacteriaceae endosymbiont of Plateumaris consimilis TaxID=2675794 RepID=UPI001448D217|nr:NADH-quinone oxidoreductase subunit L [Enterobacteriaceae endosymbiont of Plateumaris consimilis]QJC28766.1 NADH-quinone oxidoreductase subunit L [Enterobacteriaceae endosymbiont of Plateumaris consimilis]